MFHYAAANDLRPASAVSQRLTASQCGQPTTYGQPVRSANDLRPASAVSRAVPRPSRSSVPPGVQLAAQLLGLVAGGGDGLVDLREDGLARQLG